MLVLVDRLMTSIPHDAGDQLRPSFVRTGAADEKDLLLGHGDVVLRRSPCVGHWRYAERCISHGTLRSPPPLDSGVGSWMKAPVSTGPARRWRRFTLAGFVPV